MHPAGRVPAEQRLRGVRRNRLRQTDFVETVADAFDSYEVFVDSKKLTNCRVSFAAAIHFAGLETL